jgi:hypothetical protein
MNHSSFLPLLHPLSLLLAAFVCVSCADQELIPPPVHQVRELTEHAVADTIDFVADADSYTRAAMIRGTFGGHLYTVQITVTGWTGGTGVLRVLDPGEHVLHADSLRSDTSYAFTTTSSSTPWALAYALSAFTGRLVCRVQRGVPTPDLFSARFYPTAVGCRWRYAVSYLGLTRDTVTVTIEKDTLIAGGRAARLWRFSGLAWTRQAVSYDAGDTLMTSFIDGELWPEERFVFPLMLGQTWQAPESGFVVDSSDPILFSWGGRAEAYRIFQMLLRGDETEYLQYYIVPGLGLARHAYHYHATNYFGYVDKYWDLIEASVVVPGPSPALL